MRSTLAKLSFVLHIERVHITGLFVKNGCDKVLDQWLGTDSSTKLLNTFIAVTFMRWVKLVIARCLM